MAFDVIQRGKFWVAGNPKWLSVLLSLFILDFDLFLLLLTIFNGGHQVVQHFHVGDLDAGDVIVWRWTYMYCTLDRGR